MTDQIDYGKYYDDEKYLLDEVGQCFRMTGKLEPADFYTILIWKAERAKNRHRKRLKEIAGCSFKEAVHDIASELHASADCRRRLEVLMKRWGFLLPTASAILTILYPDEFTVYDWRVCQELGCEYGPWCSRGYSDVLWSHYESFRQAVIDQTPSHLSLRDKDRFLTGRSIRRTIENDSES
jgi:hypothetical protein